MALFPTTIPVGFETDLKPDSGRNLELSEDGTVTVLRMFNASVYQGQIVCPFCTSAERDTIRTFYTDNKDVVWTFQHPGDGRTYSLYFLNEPIEMLEAPDVNHYKVTLAVAGTL